MEGGREGGMEGGREGGREGERDGGRKEVGGRRVGGGQERERMGKSRGECVTRRITNTKDKRCTFLRKNTRTVMYIHHTSFTKFLAAFRRTSGPIFGTREEYSPTSHRILAFAMGTWTIHHENSYMCTTLHRTYSGLHYKKRKIEWKVGPKIKKGRVSKNHVHVRVPAKAA